MKQTLDCLVLQQDDKIKFRSRWLQTYLLIICINQSLNANKPKIFEITLSKTPEFSCTLPFTFSAETTPRRHKNAAKIKPAISTVPSLCWQRCRKVMWTNQNRGSIQTGNACLLNMLPDFIGCRILVSSLAKMEPKILTSVNNWTWTWKNTSSANFFC